LIKVTIMTEAANLLRNFEKEDLRILMAIEIGMKRSEYVKISNIKFYARYPLEETLFRLKKVHKANLTIMDSSGHEIAYTLNSIGYDLLALHTLVERKVISQLGPLVGKGKESDVYSCMDDLENVLALKVFRMGRTSFKNIKRYRNLIQDRTHLSWLYVNRLAARKEYQALKRLQRLNLNTPRPIAFNRHMLVMSYLRGKELIYFKSIKKPDKIFNKIIQQLKVIYQKAGMVHGDLGEFNIILDEKGNVLIIDWVQWVPKTHPNANSLLERDIENVCAYFKKKFNVESDSGLIIASFLKN
jgi:RIO kinase 2